MDYKQKYEEALERAKMYQWMTVLPAESMIETIFPELGESDDKRIRGEITEFLKKASGGFLDTTTQCKTFGKWLACLEKQGEQTDKIVERAKTEKQRVLITESDGEANIDWDTRSLQDVKLLLEYGLDYVKKLDEKNCLSNTKSNMDDLKIISSLKNIIHAYWNSLPNSALEENEVAESCYRWLEKQGTPARLSEEEQNRFAKGVLTSCALSFINYLDAHKYEGKMCVSNGECEDIENAFHNAMWDKLHRYYCKYIEKQEEQKPINKVQPKFKVGDWIVYREGIWKIGNIALENYYELLKTNNEVATRSIKEVDENARLWTIQDSKDGDVLKEDSCIFIIAKLGDNGHAAKTYCCLFDDGEFNDGSILCFDVEGTKPATKEQRDLLFQKMKEAGYEWDAKNKELNKIHIIDEGKSEMDYCFTKMMNGEKVSSTWSEEDESMYTRTLGILGKCYMGQLPTKVEEELNWFKTLKERIGG